MKKKPKSKDIRLDYTARAIMNTSAMEFHFAEKLTIVAIHVPKVGVIVVGRGNPSRCWSYPPETSFQDAVSKTFRQILEETSKKLKAKHDAC